MIGGLKLKFDHAIILVSTFNCPIGPPINCSTIADQLTDC